MARMIVIEHKDGRRFAVAPADYRRLYAPEGFKAVAYEDGEPYEAPAAEGAPAKATGKRDD